MCEFVSFFSPTRLELHHWASDTYNDKYQSVCLTNDDTKRNEEEEGEGKQRIGNRCTSDVLLAILSLSLYC